MPRLKAADAPFYSLTDRSPEPLAPRKNMLKPTEPLLWRVNATSGDGQRVVLGKFATKEQADAELEKSKRAGYYKDLSVVEIPQPEPAATAGPGGGQPAKP